MEGPRCRLRIRQMAADTCDTQTATRRNLEPSRTTKDEEAEARTVDDTRGTKQVLIVPDEALPIPSDHNFASVPCRYFLLGWLRERDRYTRDIRPTLGVRSSATVLRRRCE